MEQSSQMPADREVCAYCGAAGARNGEQDLQLADANKQATPKKSRKAASTGGGD
jgi:hypothetical protein